MFRKMIDELEKVTEAPIVDPNTKQVVGRSDIEEVVMEQIGEPGNWAFDIKWVKPAAKRKECEPVMPGGPEMDRIVAPGASAAAMGGDLPQSVIREASAALDSGTPIGPAPKDEPASRPSNEVEADSQD